MNFETIRMPKGILTKKMSQKSRSSRTLLILSMFQQRVQFIVHTTLPNIWNYFLISKHFFYSDIIKLKAHSLVPKVVDSTVFSKSYFHSSVFDAQALLVFESVLFVGLSTSVAQQFFSCTILQVFCQIYFIQAWVVLGLCLGPDSVLLQCIPYYL